MTDLPIAAAKLSLPELVMMLFLRCVALGCLWFALLLWGDLIGYGHAGAGRFDLLASDVKAGRGALAVIYPVAAIGLWLRGPWGPVIWSAAAAIELTMHQSMPDTFGSDPLKVALISLTALTYLLLRLWLLLSRSGSSKAG